MSKAPRVIVSVTNDLYTDQRVHKVCMFLLEQGYNVLLVGRKRRSSVELPDRPYQTKRMKLLFEKGPMFYACFNFRLFCFLFFRKADILLSNDLDTLLANHVAKKFKSKCKLVYDSHEYFTEVPELINRPKVQKFWLRIERKIFPKVDHVYTVNESIAEIYRNIYKKDVKVVRNISPLWKPENLLSKKELGIPENKNLIIMQGAGINIDRGGEEAVEAMKAVDGVLMIVGDGDVVPQLKAEVEKNNLNERVIFYGKRPYDELLNFTYHADIGLTLDKRTNKNYKFSLPNKVFDYMHTGTPVVATNVKEVARVVNTHKIGEIIDNFNVESLTETLNNLLQDKTRLKEYKDNCLKAAQIENWEKETKVLKEIYPKVE
jgi:glycosyltransferase involved in cell wall biosynthesis